MKHNLLLASLVGTLASELRPASRRPPSPRSIRVRAINPTGIVPIGPDLPWIGQTGRHAQEIVDA